MLGLMASRWTGGILSPNCSNTGRLVRFRRALRRTVEARNREQELFRKALTSQGTFDLLCAPSLEEFILGCGLHLSREG
jgi:hypothetical protein